MNSPRKIEYKDYSMSSQLGQCSQRKLQNLSRRNFPDKHIKIIIKQMYAAILSVLFLVQFDLWFLEIVCGSEFYWHNVLTDSTLQARDWSCLGNLSIGTLLSVSGKLNTHIVQTLPQSATHHKRIRFWSSRIEGCCQSWPSQPWWGSIFYRL